MDSPFDLEPLLRSFMTIILLYIIIRAVHLMTIYLVFIILFVVFYFSFLFVFHHSFALSEVLAASHQALPRRHNETLFNLKRKRMKMRPTPELSVARTLRFADTD